jgi:hypothetical protein
MSEFEIAIALFDFIKTLELSAEQQAYFDTLREAWNNLQDGGSEGMSECAISNCGYYWQEEGEDYPRCHFDGFGKAPCEEDDWDEN